MNLKALKNVIDRIVEFGINPEVNSTDKVSEIRTLLVSLYTKYLISDEVEATGNFKEDYNFEYEKIRKIVESNFPDLSMYISVWDSHKIEYEKGKSNPIVNSVLEDAIDDISDIIKDLMEVKWRFENTSNEDAMWHFRFLMKNHSEQHLVNLLKYLKDREV